MRTCARLGCRNELTGRQTLWCGDACRMAAKRDPVQGTVPSDWPERSRAFWTAMEARVLVPLQTPIRAARHGASAN